MLRRTSEEEPMQLEESEPTNDATSGDVTETMSLSFPPPEHQPFINRLAAGDRDSW